MTRHIVDATESDLRDEDTRKALARALGRLGGLKGGKARAAKLSLARAQAKAARERWKRQKQQQP